MLLVSACVFVLGLLTVGGRTSFGRIVRGIACQEPPGMLRARYLFADVRNRADLAPLQTWCVDAMARFQRREFRTVPAEACCRFDSLVQLDHEEVPAWLRNVWPREDMRVAIKLGADGMPECVVLCFCGGPEHGLMVGKPAFAPGEQQVYLMRPSPGVYAYWRQGGSE